MFADVFPTFYVSFSRVSNEGAYQRIPTSDKSIVRLAGTHYEYSAGTYPLFFKFVIAYFYRYERRFFHIFVELCLYVQLVPTEVCNDPTTFSISFQFLFTSISLETRWLKSQTFYFPFWAIG